MTLRAVVVDDEAVARRRVARLLSEREDVELVGEAAGGEAALEVIARLRPDIVFLDIQMPDLDGFEVLRRLDARRLPAVVFVTAYDQHALRAFEACAIDYLLKPYEPERFDRAVDRAIRWARREAKGPLEERIEALLEKALGEALGDVLGRERGTREEAGGPAPLERFVVRHRGRSEFVKAAEVDWIEADGNYVRLHVGPADHLVRGTIASCAARLDPGRFVRIHRRFIVNLDRVKEVQPWFGGDQVVVLDTGRKLRLSRTFREAFRSRMLGD